MRQGLGVRIFLFLLISGMISFFAFIASVMTILFQIHRFYLPFIIVVTLFLIFLVFNGFFRIIQGKSLDWLKICFISIAILSVGVYEGVNAYDNAIPTMRDGEIDLYEYHPFVEESKVVKLDEPITFKAEGELPKIDGATALYPIYAAFAQATYPEKQYDVYDSEIMSNRTPNAYNNLINGKVDIIFALAPSESQLNRAKQKGVELKLTPIGKEAFVFFVNSKNKVEDVTLNEIKGIYSGEIKNWREVGGANDSIRAFQRPEDSGSQTTLVQLMGETPIMEAPKDDIVSLMGGIIEETANYKNYKSAIGYSFRFYSQDMALNNSIRHLAIDGVHPTKETIRSGEYPISYPFYAVTAGSDNPNIDSFIEWILSEQGQQIIEETGYVAINKMEEN